MLSNAFPFAYFNVLDHLEAIYMIKCAWIWPRNEYHHKSTENIWFTDRFTDRQQSAPVCRGNAQCNSQGGRVAIAFLNSL